MIIQTFIMVFVFTCIFLIALFAFPRKTETAIRQRLISESQGVKKKNIFIQFLGTLAPINRRLVTRPLREKIQRRLLLAGLVMNAEEYLALQELSLLFVPALVLFIMGRSIPLLWVGISVAVGFILPNLWLKQKIANRHKAIAKALPDIIDLLALAIGAGLDFMVALGKVVERAEVGPLTDELRQVWQETKVGKARRDAFKAMAARIGLPDVSSFVRTLIQAERMGTPIGDVMRIQSEQARNWRFQRGERLALKAPIKLLLPLVFFILPVVLIIVGGPIFLQFMTSGPFLK